MWSASPVFLQVPAQVSYGFLDVHFQNVTAVAVFRLDPQCSHIVISRRVTTGAKYLQPEWESLLLFMLICGGQGPSLLEQDELDKGMSTSHS